MKKNLRSQTFAPLCAFQNVITLHLPLSTMIIKNPLFRLSTDLRRDRATYALLWQKDSTIGVECAN